MVNVMNMIGIKTGPLATSATINKGSIPQSFWLKRRQSSQVVSWFFGQKIQVDVSVSEIKKYGLGALLQSNVPLCYFLYYLLDNYCSENLFFHIEVESFEAHQFSSPDDLRRTARQLYHCFIREKSDFEVNLEATVTKPIKKAIEAGDQQCFSEAKQHIYHLLEPAYVQFTLSPIYQQMAEELGLNTTIYLKDKRDHGVSVLLKHLDKSLPSEVAGVKSSDQAIAAERTRARLIRNLIHSFCRTRLGCDFWDQQDQKNLDAIKPAEIMARSQSDKPF